MRFSLELSSIVAGRYCDHYPCNLAPLIRLGLSRLSLVNLEAPKHFGVGACYSKRLSFMLSLR